MATAELRCCVSFVSSPSVDSVVSARVPSTCCCSDPTSLLHPVPNAKPIAWFKSSSFALATWPNCCIC